MSNKMKVRTEAIIALSDEIASANDEIECEYNDTIRELTNMFNWWDGKACETAKETLTTIKTAFSGERYKAINNYVRFLKISVGQGYEAVEIANTDLSKCFM